MGGAGDGVDGKVAKRGREVIVEFDQYIEDSGEA